MPCFFYIFFIIFFFRHTRMHTCIYARAVCLVFFWNQQKKKGPAIGDVSITLGSICPSPRTASSSAASGFLHPRKKFRKKSKKKFKANTGWSAAASSFLNNKKNHIENKTSRTGVCVCMYIRTHTPYTRACTPYTRTCTPHTRAHAPYTRAYGCKCRTTQLTYQIAKIITKKSMKNFKANTATILYTIPTFCTVRKPNWDRIFTCHKIQGKKNPSKYYHNVTYCT